MAWVGRASLAVSERDKRLAGAVRRNDYGIGGSPGRRVGRHPCWTNHEVLEPKEAPASLTGRDVTVQTAVSPIPSSSRGWIHGPGNDEFIKLIADAAILIGATYAGPAGGDVLGTLAVAVHAQVPIAMLSQMLYAYPTLHPSHPRRHRPAVLTSGQIESRFAPQQAGASCQCGPVPNPRPGRPLPAGTR